MSDLRGPMTKQILSQPARPIRSIRYSETARGRSISPSVRLPTGSSSFENASGFMRLPTPAAGMMPSMIGPSSFEQLEELLGAVRGGVLGERAGPGGAADPA